MNNSSFRIGIWNSQHVVEKSAATGIARALLENECHVMARLAGVNAPRIIDVDTSNSTLIMRRAFLPGRTLAETPKVEWPTLLTKLKENVATSHLAGFIHGDLKPENLIVNGRNITPVDWEHALQIGRGIADLPLRAASLGTSDPRLIWAKGVVSRDLDHYSIDRMFDISH